MNNAHVQWKPGVAAGLFVIARKVCRSSLGRSAQRWRETSESGNRFPARFSRQLTDTGPKRSDVIVI